MRPYLVKKGKAEDYKNEISALKAEVLNGREVDSIITI